MLKTLFKAVWLLTLVMFLFDFFRDAQAHNWLWAGWWAAMVCVCASNYSDLRWKNVAIVTTIKGVVTTQEFWTRKGAAKVFHASVEAWLKYARDNNIPTHEHNMSIQEYVEKISDKGDR